MDYRNVRGGTVVSASRLPRSNPRPVAANSPRSPYHHGRGPVASAYRKTTVPANVRRAVRRAVKQAAQTAVRSGRLPRTPLELLVRAVLADPRVEARAGELASEVLWGHSYSDIRGTPGLWYGRLSASDLTPPVKIPGTVIYNDFHTNWGTMVDGPFKNLWKYISKDLIEVKPATYWRTHEIEPTQPDGSYKVNPSPYVREGVVPWVDPFSQPDAAPDPMPDLALAKVPVPRQWVQEIPISGLTPLPAPPPAPGRVTGVPGPRVRERKGRSIAAGLAAAWVGTTALEIIPELVDIYETYYKDDDQISIDEVDDVLFELFKIAIEEVFIDPVIAKYLGPKYVTYDGRTVSVGPGYRPPEFQIP